ncbi:MAG: hypothetical protein ACD_75C01492G0005 [uncultured bacterium]|nr:MAG: hypothetical protein ACD_75C01492G0005 [uncultured bacterium]
MAQRACRVVLVSLNWISWLCSERPEVWIWYLSRWEVVFAPYFSFMATAQMRLATRPITVYSGSMPFEKKNDKFGAISSISMPRAR